LSYDALPNCAVGIIHVHAVFDHVRNKLPQGKQKKAWDSRDVATLVNVKPRQKKANLSGFKCRSAMYNLKHLETCNLFVI
jgi:hypothetical protein